MSEGWGSDDSLSSDGSGIEEAVNAAGEQTNDWRQKEGAEGKEARGTAAYATPPYRQLAVTCVWRSLSQSVLQLRAKICVRRIELIGCGFAV